MTPHTVHRDFYASSKHKAFRAVVLPVLDYTYVVWNPYTQKKHLGVCWVAMYVTADSDCCCELNYWPSLSTHCKHLSLSTMYDILHCHILDFSEYFTFSTSLTSPLNILGKHSNSLRYSLFVNSIYFWNCVHNIIVYFLYPAVPFLRINCTIFVFRIIFFVANNFCYNRFCM